MASPCYFEASRSHSDKINQVIDNGRSALEMIKRQWILDVKEVNELNALQLHDTLSVNVGGYQIAISVMNIDPDSFFGGLLRFSTNMDDLFIDRDPILFASTVLPYIRGGQKHRGLHHLPPDAHREFSFFGIEPRRCFATRNGFLYAQGREYRPPHPLGYKDYASWSTPECTYYVGGKKMENGCISQAVLCEDLFGNVNQLPDTVRARENVICVAVNDQLHVYYGCNVDILLNDQTWSLQKNYRQCAENQHRVYVNQSLGNHDATLHTVVHIVVDVSSFDLLRHETHVCACNPSLCIHSAFGFFCIGNLFAPLACAPYFYYSQPSDNLFCMYAKDSGCKVVCQRVSASIVDKIVAVDDRIIFCKHEVELASVTVDTTDPKGTSYVIENVLEHLQTLVL